MSESHPYWTEDGTRVTPAQVKLLRRCLSGWLENLTGTQVRTLRALVDKGLVHEDCDIDGARKNGGIGRPVKVNPLVRPKELLRGSWSDVFGGGA